VSPSEHPTHLTPLSVCLSIVCLFWISTRPHLSPVRFSNSQEQDKTVPPSRYIVILPFYWFCNVWFFYPCLLIYSFSDTFFCIFGVAFIIFYVWDFFKYLLQCWLVVMNFFSFCLSWKVFISHSLLKDSCAGYTNLVWQLLSFRS
jgi:hypothetical protein